jgi:hypothetical protein
VGKIVFVPYGLLNKLEIESDFSMTKEDYVGAVTNLWSHYQINDLLRNDVSISEKIVFSEIRKHYIVQLRHTSQFINEYYNDLEASIVFELLAESLDTLQLPNQP